MAWKTHWKTVAIAAVGALVVAFGAGGTAWALHGNDQPAQTTSTSTSARLGGGHGARGAIGRRGLLRRLSSAEITVAANGTARVIRIDHGTIASISSTAVTLQEADGRTVRIPLDSSTRVVLDGATASVSSIKAGDETVVVRTDGSPAKVLRARDASAGRAAVAGGA